MRWMLGPVLLLATACPPELDGRWDIDPPEPVPPLGDTWDIVSFVDEGTYCLSRSNAVVEMTVTAPACSPQACQRDLASSCALTVVGEATLVATSEFGWLEDREVDCPERCRPATVTCRTAAPGAAKVRLRVGSEEVSIDLSEGGAGSCVRFPLPRFGE